MTDNYTTKQLRSADINFEVIDFIRKAAHHAQDDYETDYSWWNFPLHAFADFNYLSVCFRNDQPVGFMAASLIPNFFDRSKIILLQNLLYALPNTRAAHYLMEDFIDFGKANANHVISSIGKKTNIKPASLIRLGFEELETLYRLEI